MASKASAVWTGSLKEGKGTISTATGVLNNANYSFATRFEGATSGTTPEELIAAAHASCFSMALGAQLGGAGLTPEKIETHAAVTLAKTDGGFAITKIALTSTAKRSRRQQGGLRQGGRGRQGGMPDFEAVRQQYRHYARRQAGVRERPSCIRPMLPAPTSGREASLVFGLHVRRRKCLRSLVPCGESEGAVTKGSEELRDFP